jgi:hypothetical protein
LALTALQHRAVCNDDSFSGPWHSDINAARKDAAKHNKANPDHDVEVITEQSGAMEAMRSAILDRRAGASNPFAPRPNATLTPLSGSRVHLLKKGIVCDTEPRGHATPRGRSITEIVVDSSNGFIPLWAPETTLRWRFREASLEHLADPAVAKTEIRQLFAASVLAWGAAAPIKFTEDDDLWDFEIVMQPGDSCTVSGCVLASAFFPDAGRHKLTIFPKMFEQTNEEQLETLVHEIGHIFGLRHFFAQVSETDFSSEIFGTHTKFSIMNYGELSKLNPADKDDLRRLYRQVWLGKLTQINGTPIHQVRPYSASTGHAAGAFGQYSLGTWHTHGPRS